MSQIHVTRAALADDQRFKDNIDTRITDGTIEVHAWTIIAEGPIKRPHYRYIIK